MNLANNEFSGPIPAEIGQLDQLTSLSLQSNTLSGLLPYQLGSLSSLTLLNLQSNRFQGQLPQSLGSISNLQNLSLEGNAFTGQMPSVVCDIGSLVAVTVDCEAVDCSCCQNCQDPTISPTAAATMGTPRPTVRITAMPTVRITAMPTVRITAMPTMAAMTATTMPSASRPPPTLSNPDNDCHDVKVVGGCIEQGQPIALSTFICDPIPEADVIALYRLSDMKGNSMRDPLIWQSPCGLYDCHGTLTEGRLWFDGFQSQPLDDLPWPLPNEKYILLLIRFVRKDSIEIIAESRPFEVTDVCS
jgi:Leucine rich repeat